MEKRSYKAELIRQLADWLSDGIGLTPDVVDYIESTLAPASADELERLLNEADNCEAEAAIELILFPDPALQEKIEPTLEAAELNETDASEIIQCLCRMGIQAGVSFPENRKKINLRVPDTAIVQLVSRLHLTRRLKPELTRAVSETISDPTAGRQIGVKLRNARISQSGNQIDFLSTLIRRAPKDNDELGSLLDFAIYLLEQTDADADLYAALMAHKKFLIRAIYTAQKSEAVLSSNTVEALIMQGINIPSISVESARRTIARIDRTSLLIFGKTEHLPSPEAGGQSMDMTIQNESDIHAMLKLLGG